MRIVKSSISILALAAVGISIPSVSRSAQGVPPCEIGDSTEIDGTVSAAINIRAVRVGIDPEPVLEAQLRFGLAPTLKTDDAAPDVINVRIAHLAEGKPVRGKTGIRSLIIETPGIAGTGNKGPQPTVTIKASAVGLGVRNIAREGDVLFFTEKSGVSPATMEQMDLGKFLSRPRDGADMTIILRDSAGKEMAQYLLTGSAIQSLKSSMSKGYGIVWPAAGQGKCEPQVVLSAYT